VVVQVTTTMLCSAGRMVVKSTASTILCARGRARERWETPLAASSPRCVPSGVEATEVEIDGGSSDLGFGGRAVVLRLAARAKP
jgi:hypothetical protein